MWIVVVCAAEVWYNDAMADLSRTDIKEVVVSALGPFAKAVQEDFNVVKKELKEIRSELKSEVEGVKFDLAEVKSDVKWMKANSGELFAKLDEFINFIPRRETRKVFAR